MNGFINLYKPLGLTASDMVVRVRKKLSVSKVGHLGTLDPQAEGVLPLALGNATKLFELLTYKQKTYIANITFGTQTDTLDREGEINSTSTNIPDKNQVESVIKTFKGISQQIPPQFSALSVNGVRAYKLARAGIEVELSSRPIEIYSIRLINQIDELTFQVEICCSGGTYIRSLVRDIAYRLDTVAYMSSLLRTASGIFKIEKCLTLDTLTANDIIPILDILQDYPKLIIEDKYYFQLINGIKFFIADNDETMKTVYCKNEFFGVGNISQNKLNLRYYLRETAKF